MMLPRIIGRQCVTACRSFANKASQDGPPPSSDSANSQGSWLGNMFSSKRNKLPLSDNVSATAPDQAHSSALADSHHVYELSRHNVKPDQMEGYVSTMGNFFQLLERKGTGASLVGSFTTSIGRQDDAIHIVKYDSYDHMDRAVREYRNDDDFVDFRRRRNEMLHSRETSVMMKFSFWNDAIPREAKPDGTNHMYELREYRLKPGSLIDWGNYWARGIQHRQLNDEAVCGWFSQIGPLYTVWHLWSYDSLASRAVTRQAAWMRPGWDDNVAYTVPLLRSLESRIMVPTPYSPLK